MAVRSLRWGSSDKLKSADDIQSVRLAAQVHLLTNQGQTEPQHLRSPIDLAQIDIDISKIMECGGFAPPTPYLPLDFESRRKAIAGDTDLSTRLIDIGQLRKDVRLAIT